MTVSNVRDITQEMVSVFNLLETPKVDDELKCIFNKNQQIKSESNFESYWEEIPTVFDNLKIWQCFTACIEAKFNLKESTLSPLVTRCVNECVEYKSDQSRRFQKEKQCRSYFINALDDLNLKFDLIEKLLIEVHATYTYLGLKFFEADQRQSLNMPLLRTGIIFFEGGEKFKRFLENLVFFQFAQKIVANSDWHTHPLVNPLMSSLKLASCHPNLMIHQLKKFGELLFEVLYKAKYKAYLNTSFVNPEFAVLKALWEV